MVFINKVKDIIKIFQESTREEIGTALLAYEEYICKGNKVSDSALKKLSDIFNYYDEKFSSEYPSLTNKALSNVDNLICGYCSKFYKDGYCFNISYEDRVSNGTVLNISVSEKSSFCCMYEFQYTVTDQYINCNYDKDHFNTTFKACQAVKEEIKKTNIEDLIRSYKL